MREYTSIQGDMWDNIAYKVYGDETKIYPLIEANPEYRDIYVFPGGIVLTVPEVEEETGESVTASVPIWR